MTPSAARSKPIRVVVVDDHEAVRTGLARVLERSPVFDSVSALADDRDLFALLQREPVDVVVLDYDLERTDGLSLCLRIKQRREPPAVVIYSGYAAPALVLAATVAQADAVVHKADPVDVLLGALRRLTDGDRLLAIPAPDLLEAAAARLEAVDVPVMALLLHGVRTPRSPGRSHWKNARPRTARGASSASCKPLARVAGGVVRPAGDDSRLASHARRLRFLAPHDASFAIEVEHDSRHVEVRADLLGHPVLTPVLMLAAGSVEPEHDQISVELGQRIADRGDLVLGSHLAVRFQAARAHVGKHGPQPLVGGDERVVSVVGQPVHPRRQCRGDDVDVLGFVEKRTNRFGNLVGVGQILVGQNEHMSGHQKSFPCDGHRAGRRYTRHGAGARASIP